MKRCLLVTIVVLLAFSITGSNTAFGHSPEKNVFSLSPDAVLEILGEGVSITLTAEQMRGRPQETIICESINSSGNTSQVTVTGFSLNELLIENDVDMMRVASINFIASDGYVMSAPAEVYAETPVYIMLNSDGKGLTYPRSCIPNQRSMYWVKNLAKIELISEQSLVLQEQVGVQRISFFREAIQGLEPRELNNRGHKVPAYPLDTYFEQCIKEVPDSPVTMIALDGFEKTETPDIFLSNYVTLEAEQGKGDDLPLYFSEEISLGMRVKQLNIVISREDAVYFGSKISVPELFQIVGMKESETYKFIASDGYVSEIPLAAIPFGTIYPDEKKGYLRAQFEGYDFSGAAGGGKVKYLVAIEVME